MKLQFYLTNVCKICIAAAVSWNRSEQKGRPSVLIEFQLIYYYWMCIWNKPYTDGIKVLSVMRNKVTSFICVLFYISRTTIPDRYPYFMQLVSPHDVLSRSRSTRGHNKFISSLAPAAAAMESQTNCPLLL